MKARRNFVVEFKSNRRQARGASTSIWGDTDLKAIARAVESELPNTGGGADAERATERPPLVPARPAARILETINKPNDQPTAAPSGEPAKSELPTLPADAARSPAETDDAPALPVPVSAPEETRHETPAGRRAASKPSRPASKRTAKSRRAAQPGQTGSDDLDALETENRRLRALWRAHLHAENAQLRDMLARLPST